MPDATALVARRCVILHWFNQEIIESLLPESTSNQAIAVYQQLESLPFIASVPYGLTYHDLTREGLLERYIVRQPDLLQDGANILLEVARLRLATENRDEALRLAEEALTITERCGYVLQGADVHLFLAQLALADGDREKPLFHAREAQQLATCDGSPDYTYKVAYEEAGVLLEELGEGK